MASQSMSAQSRESQELNKKRKVDPNKTRVLVTGGSGFLGQHLLHYLANTDEGSKDLDVTYTFCETQLQEPIKGVHMDLRDSSSVTEALAQIMPDVIVHMAASSSPGYCAKNQEQAQIVNAPKNLLTAIDSLYKEDRPLLIYLSTDQVYEGEVEEAPYQTSTNAKPVNTYGVSKLEFENMLSLTNQGHFVVLRSSNMVGPPSPFTQVEKFLQWLEGKLSQDKEIDLFEDEVRSYVHVHDVCEIIVRIIQKWRANTAPPIWAETGMVYNMGGPEPFSRIGMSQVLCDAYPTKYNRMLSSGGAKVVASRRADMDDVFGYTSPLDISMDSSAIQHDLHFKFRHLKESL